MLSAHYLNCIFYVLQNTFTMVANTVNPDQLLLWEQSDLGAYCLQYRLCVIYVRIMSCVCRVFASFHCCLVVTCWERADLLALVCDV